MLFVTLFQVQGNLENAKLDVKTSLYSWNLKPDLVIGPGAGLTADPRRRFWKL